MAKLAAAYGWTEQDVYATTWYNVPKYYEAAGKAEAERMQHDLLIQKAQGETIKEISDMLQRWIDGPEDPRLAEAKRLDTIASTAERFNNLEMAKKHRDHAKYLRACARRGIDA